MLITNSQVKHEQYKDRLRAARQQRLIKQLTINKEQSRGFVRRIGAELIKWGARLQSQASTPPQPLRYVKGE